MWKGNGDIQTRWASTSDGPSLLALTRCCPMRAAVSLGIERDPDFFALSRARGQSRTLLAESGGGTVGCIGTARRPAWVEGKRAEVAHVADLKIAPGYRGRGVGARLLADAIEHEALDRSAPLLATIALGNRPADFLAASCSRAAGLAGTVDVASLQLFRAPAPNEGDFEISRARPEDEAELGEFLDGFYRARQFAPIFAEGGLRELLNRSPALSLEDHLVARKRRRIIAAVALWDQSSFKRARVIGVTLWLRVVFMTLAMTARVLPVPVPPRIGDLVRLAFLRHPAHAPGEEAALAALLRRATRDAAAAGHQFAVLTLAQGDPLRRCARGIPRLTYRYRLLVGATATLAEPASLNSRIAFDDAALA